MTQVATKGHKLCMALGEVTMWHASMISKESLTITGRGENNVERTVCGYVNSFYPEDGSGYNWYVIIGGVKLFVKLDSKSRIVWRNIC